MPKLAPQPATAAAATSDNAPTAALPPAAKPKVAALVAKPAPQKSYALLSDAQIAGIKERLRLTSDQEYYWPGIENALRGIARKIHAARQHDPNATAAQIDPGHLEAGHLFDCP